MPVYVGICYFLYGGERAGRPTEVHGESLAKFFLQWAKGFGYHPSLPEAYLLICEIH